MKESEVHDPRCHLALFGWPRSMVVADGTTKQIQPCVGYIESDYDPGTFYPCATCNPNWQRVTLPDDVAFNPPPGRGV